MIKKIGLILLLCIQMVWAEDSCDFSTDGFVSNIKNRYEKKLEGYTLVVNPYKVSCQKIKNTSNAIILLTYKDVKDEENQEISFARVVTIVDFKNKKLKQGSISFSEQDRESGFYETNDAGTIDIRSYKSSSSSLIFSVSLSFFESHHTLYIYSHYFIIYEVQGENIKQLLYKESSSSLEPYAETRIESQIESSLSTNNSFLNHEDLKFDRVYTFSYKDKKLDKDWRVKLDEYEIYTYKNGKYELVKKKYKPIFDLNTVLLNTQKGLKYKEIVLRAMLYEEPLNKDNVDIYTQIAQALKKAKHTKEAEFLKDRILTPFPKQEILFQEKK